MGDFENGEAVIVRQRDTDEKGNVIWTPWFRGEYVTTENVGNGREHRIKQNSTGRHIHINPGADDLEIEAIDDE